MDMMVLSTGLAAGLAFIGLGGGFYETRVLDPVWPDRPALVQPARGGVSRVRFWLPAHIAYELCLTAALALCWNAPAVRSPLLAALAAHAIMRIWSAFDFIPKALAFERAESVDPVAARRWTGRSWMRLPLDILACIATLGAFGAACRVAM